MKINTSTIIALTVLLIGTVTTQPLLWIPLSVLIASLIDLFTRNWVVSNRLGSAVTFSIFLKFIFSLIGFYALIGQFVSLGLLAWWFGWYIIILILVLGCIYLVYKKYGGLNFWKIINEYPDVALTFFKSYPNTWKLFSNYEDAIQYKESHRPDWTGIFTITTNNGGVMYGLGKHPDYLESQKEFMNSIQNFK